MSPVDFAPTLSKFDKIYTIVSPPRCGSTAFARVFWEHPSVGYYCHEPFEVTYYQKDGLEVVDKLLQNPLDLSFLHSKKQHGNGTALVIKEMPYQAGSNFPLLISWAQKPVIFLIRDPRLNIASRIKKKLETGDSPKFPLIETGWELINGQIKHCESEGIPFIIVDASEFRNHPAAIFRQVFEQLGLPFSDSMLQWQSCPDIDLDNLGGNHTHLYRRVLLSEGIQPATENIQAIEDFPEEYGIREHLKECMDIYQTLLQHSNRIQVQ